MVYLPTFGQKDMVIFGINPPLLNSTSGALLASSFFHIDRIRSKVPKKSFRQFSDLQRVFQEIQVPSFGWAVGWLANGLLWFFYGAKMTKIQVSWRFLLVRLLRRQAKKPTEFWGVFFLLGFPAG